MHPDQQFTPQENEEGGSVVINTAGREENETPETEISLWNLPEVGTVVSGRYLIEWKDSRCMQSGFLGRDLSTGHPVWLRFYSTTSPRLENVLKMYDILKDSDVVCRCIERIPGEEGNPECLVCEAGSHTLAQILGGGRQMSPVERQFTVHAILDALRRLHQQNVVHGNLHPSCIVWSSIDFCWKFLDLEFSAEVGDSISLHKRVATRYTAPEIQKAAEQNRGFVKADFATDLWSFGLIAFEIFTGASVLDAALVKTYVSQECSRLRRQLQTNKAAGSCFSGEPSSRDAQRLPEFELIARLLAEPVGDRPSALQACESDVFRVTSDLDFATQPTDRQSTDNVRLEQEQPSPRSQSVPDWLVRYVTASHLSVSVAVERFAEKGDSMTPFHRRETLKPKQFMDDYLPKHPVHVLHTGEPFRLRITVTITRSTQFRIPLEEVASVELQPPDSEAKPLEITQHMEGDRLELLALVDPSSFPSVRLNTKCPMFGLVDTKYVPLIVHSKLRMGEDFPGDLDAYSPIYLQLKRPPGRFAIFRRR